MGEHAVGSGAPRSLAPFGLAVGHASDEAGATGCTVVRGAAGPFRAAAATFGRATGTRELHVLTPEHLVDRVDAILLSGGSAYGLDAASGVMRWMEERGRGFDVGAGVVPIVPAAVVFDLAPLGRFDARPTAAMAYAACDAARDADVEEGAVGAGTGTTVGKAAGVERAMKGGVGLAEAWAEDVGVVALAVVNAFGDVRDATGRIIAGARGDDGRFLDGAHLVARGASTARFDEAASPASTIGNTTLCVVAASVPMDRVALAQLARAASGALHRRIAPVATSVDGDVVFAISPIGEASASVASALQLEALAVEALEGAIERAVRLARGRAGIPGLADASAGAAR